jgi:protein Tex
MEAKRFASFDLHRTIEGIAKSLGITLGQVRATVDLLDAGSTIPFIARYRKEATGSLNEGLLRSIEDAIGQARELAARKTTILQTIDGQGLLTPELQRQIEACDDKRTLEDLYLPFKPKRRTRATTARERGLQPLADLLLRQVTLAKPRSEIVRPFINSEQEVPDEESALQGACDIVAEQWSEDVPTRRWLVQQAHEHGQVVSQLKRGQHEDAPKFEMYFDYREPVRRIPSHRWLAIKRGEADGVLRVSLQLDDEFVVGRLGEQFVRNPRFEFRAELLTTVKDSYERLLLPATESSVFQELKIKADSEAIQVFAKNLRELLLAPPAGPHVTIGIDPGFRTGCKVVVVDDTGKVLAHTAIYPTPPRSDITGAGRTLLDLLAKFDVKLIAIGNGTASRETDAFVAQLLRTHGRAVTKVIVSESGASIYSASELAAQEYPDLDVTVRGAISIAHRLQDPLAELVKIDPKSIGVGQYQHDVNQSLLQKCLEREVESCVNSVGVDVNLASAALLAHVAGIGPKLAAGIVAYRDANGRFESRSQLNKVPKLGKKAYEQSAGFLRIADGEQPLDNSAVHPESYYVVQKMAKRLNVAPTALVGNAGLAQQLVAQEFVDDQFGLPTIRDIIAELARPGRDPRREFKTVQFSEGVNDLGDLKAGMILEGAITNVTHFGAFVDIGVHQDGLIHISQLSNNYVQNPSDVVAVGDVVRVKVLEVDLGRRRIALSSKQVEG